MKAVGPGRQLPSCGFSELQELLDDSESDMALKAMSQGMSSIC